MSITRTGLTSASESVEAEVQKRLHRRGGRDQKKLDRKIGRALSRNGRLMSWMVAVGEVIAAAMLTVIDEPVFERFGLSELATWGLAFGTNLAMAVVVHWAVQEILEINHDARRRGTTQGRIMTACSISALAVSAALAVVIALFRTNDVETEASLFGGGAPWGVVFGFFTLVGLGTLACVAFLSMRHYALKNRRSLRPDQVERGQARSICGSARKGISRLQAIREAGRSGLARIRGEALDGGEEVPAVIEITIPPELLAYFTGVLEDFGDSKAFGRTRPNEGGGDDPIAGEPATAPGPHSDSGGDVVQIQPEGHVAAG